MFMRNRTVFFDRTLSRRRLVLGGATFAGGLALPVRLAAAQATPASGGAPEVRFTVTKDAVTAPAAVASGINHVFVENKTGQDQLHMLTLQLPKGVMKDDVAKMQSQQDAPVPDWWLKATMVGNPDWPPAGGVSEGYIDYPAGTYAIMNIFGSQWTTFSVTTAAANVTPPPSGVEVITQDMSFRGLDDGVAAGRALWKVTNGDPVAHEMAFMQVPGATTTVDEIVTALMKGDTPPGYKMMPGGTGILTPGVSMWLYVDLTPGDYAAVCFAPDGWNGPPHALMGMIKVFSVK